MDKTIFDEVNSIAADTGALPQVLIVDHVDGNALENKEEFLCIGDTTGRTDPH